MRAITATGIVFFAVYGVATPSWADMVVARSQQYAATPATTAAAVVSAVHHRPEGNQALMSTRAEAGALAGALLPPAVPLPVAGPVRPSTAARLEPRSDDPDRTDMATMLLVGLAMLMTVVFKGNRA